jgi:hypothetical protein
MHSPALALGWELWARHRWGWSALGAGALVAAVLAQALPADEARTAGDLAVGMALFAYLYLLSIFVYAESTLGGKAAGFPPRLFALPLRTSLLVAWPMLYGAVTVALLWLGLWWLVLVPCGLARAVEWWSALLPAAYLACTQAVCWTLVRSPLVRLVVVILGWPSVVLGAALVWARYNLEVTLTQLMLGLCALIATAYAVAVAGVARDRRGDRWGWAWLGRLLLRAVPRLPGPERPFASPLAAQRWLEVRRHAWLLPVVVGLFLALLLFWATALPLSRAEVARVAAALVGFPAVLAFFVGFGMGKTSFWAGDLGLSSFLATRPLTSAALANAKLHAAWLSALTTWGLVLLLSPLWAVLSGNVEAVRALGDALFHDQPAWKLGLLAPVALAGLVGLTWLQLVAGMCLNLTGRAGVVNGVVLLYAAVGTALASLGVWTAFHPDFFATLRAVLWWLGGGLGLLKLSAAAWAWGWSGCRQGRAVTRLSLWLATTACLLVPLYAAVPEGPVPAHLVALFVVLALPLTRLTALPAAVAWNRHR